MADEKSVTPIGARSPSVHPSSARPPSDKNLLGADLHNMPPPPPLGSKKVPLAPGHSHHDWMKLQRQSALSVSQSKPVIHPPEMRIIGPEELALHNKKTDVWIALRGHVFDITEYIKFHPGGVDQIMKGAGKEATSIFNAIHRYVNFETILRGKQVGLYTHLQGSAVSAENLTHKTSSMIHRDLVVTSNTGVTKNCWGCNACDFCMDGSTLPIPYTEFTENENFVFFKVNSRGMRRNRDYWTIGVLEREVLLLKLITKPPDMWLAHFKLNDKLEDDTVTVSFTNRYKNMVLKLRKPQKLEWKKLGEPLEDHNEIEDSRAILEDMHQGTVRINEEIATSLFFIAIHLPPSAYLGIPVGWDVKIRLNGVARRYTPVHPIFHKNWDKPELADQFIYLVYKMYPDGQMTSNLCKLEPEDTSLTLGCSAGNFDTTWLQGADAFFFLAAGSGITPYFRIIEFIKEHNIALGISHVVLMYWNRVESEIVWREDFEKLETKHYWFHFVPVLTRPSDSWDGTRGRICSEVLQGCMDSIQGLTKDKRRVRFMTCGSDGFNTTVFESIEELGFHSDNLFTFLG